MQTSTTQDWNRHIVVDIKQMYHLQLENKGDSSGVIENYVYISK